MDDNGRNDRPSHRRVMMTLGVANTLLATLSWAPPAEAGSKATIRTKKPSTKRTTEQGDQQVIVRQKGNMLYVNVHGEPGLYVGAFYSLTARNRSEFKLVPGQSTKIGRDGRTSLRINVASVKAQRFYLGLAVAEDAGFERLDSETEVVEVRIQPNAAARIAGFEQLEPFDKPSVTRTISYAAKGGGGKGGGGIGGAIGGLAKKGLGMSKGFIKEQGGIGGLLQRNESSTPSSGGQSVPPRVTPAVKLKKKSIRIVDPD